MELLNDMALFVDVAQARSFRRAADATGVPSSTLSRRISALEKAIGLRLLHRTTRKVELTEAGQLYYERCRRIVEEARLAHEQLGEMQAQPSGTLRASLPVDFATTYLAPLIAEFAGLYPGIAFDLDLTPRRVDLVAEPFDVAIRMGELHDSNLIARLLAKLSVQAYASPRYLEISGEPKHPSDLAQHECLGFSKVSGQQRRHVQALGHIGLGRGTAACRDRRRRPRRRATSQNPARLVRAIHTRLRTHGNPSPACEDTALHRVPSSASWWPECLQRIAGPLKFTGPSWLAGPS